MTYQAKIKTILPGYDARHIEAYMRVEHNALDHLSPSRFHTEALFAAACVKEGGREMAERIAQSFGL